MTTTTTNTTNRQLARTSMASPIGELTILATDDAVVAIRWDHEPFDVRLTADVVDVEHGRHAVLDEAVRQLDEYFAGERLEFELPLEPNGTPFQRQAWTALCTIPYGETISYGEQARRIGPAADPRAVGQANGRNPIAVIVPCHRVIGADGSLTGYGGGVERKRLLLELEAGVLSLA